MKMYGPPSNCKRFEVGRKVSPRKCIRPLSGESFLRGLDDDAHGSVLINPSVTRDAFSPPGFPTRRWTVVSSSSLLSRPWWNVIQSSSSSWRWKSGKRSVLSKRSVFSTAIKLPPPARADGDNLCRWTAQPRRYELACWRSRQRPYYGVPAGRAGAPTARILRCRT
jgi:hypothetical protein